MKLHSRTLVLVLLNRKMRNLDRNLGTVLLLRKDMKCEQTIACVVNPSETSVLLFVIHL